MVKRTKHFLFFTMGTDSALILDSLLKLISKRKKDELVIVCLDSKGLRSGHEDKIRGALESLISQLADKDYYLSKSLMSRIFFQRVRVDVLIQDKPIVVNALDDRGRDMEMELHSVEHDKEFAPYLKMMCVQEPMIMATVPALIPYLGACENVFYLGACGSDLGTRITDRIRRLFELYFEIAAFQNDSTYLSGSLRSAGLPPYDRFMGKSIPKEYIPTIEFPLQNVRKSDVILQLREFGIQGYVIEKLEDAYSDVLLSSGTDVAMELSIYHGLKTKAYRKQQLSDLKNFLSSGELFFETKGGSWVEVPVEDIEREREQVMLSMTQRVFGGLVG
ncbi:hypothetical protein AB4254_08835 [Vibrio breoganii]